MRRTWLQLTVAVAAVYGGAWLIGLWAVGAALIVTGVAVAADAVLSNRDQWTSGGDLGTHREVLERWRQAR